MWIIKEETKKVLLFEIIFIKSVKKNFKLNFFLLSVDLIFSM